MTDTLSAEEFSAMIGQIYDCILMPERWSATIDAIRHRLGFVSGILAAYPFSGAPDVVATANLDAAYMQSASVYAGEIANLWGGLARIQRFPLAEPIAVSELQSREGLQSNSWVKPRDIGDGVTLSLARDDSMVGTLAFSQLEQNGDVRRDQIEALRLLAPHLRRAVTIGNIFAMRAAAIATLEATINTLAAGVLLVDETLTIIQSNKSAHAMLVSGDPISSRDGRVQLPSAVAQKALADAVAVGQRGIGIPAPCANGEAAVVYVLSLRQGERRFGAARERSTAALFVISATSKPVPGDAVALLFDLTPSEARIFEKVCEGQELSAIADHLGIKLSTVKTHLLRVFEKTGTNRQADVVRLAASLSLPV
jgi:DNA-binding CsgD family transcriptional regulator